MPLRRALVALARCAGRTVVLLSAHRLAQPGTWVGTTLTFGDGTSAQVYRETVVRRPPPSEPALLVVTFRLRWIRTRLGHGLFRWESELNTILFAGFPGLVSKLWIRHDGLGRYRGLYEWDGAALATAYARVLWWPLALVSAPGSISFRVVAGVRRAEVLADPGVLGDEMATDPDAWWCPSRGSEEGCPSTRDLTNPLWRRWCLTWGATPAEVGGALPGDDLLADPDIVSTRAVAVDAPPRSVWPWLAQMGSGRGGMYTYDWIENLLGLRMHSVDEVLADFQDIAVGDAQRLGTNGPTLRVAICEAATTLVLRSDDGNWVWAFVIRPDDGGARLISRNRIRISAASTASRLLGRYVMEPGSLIMERKMLLGIKRRAERLARDEAVGRSVVRPHLRQEALALRAEKYWPSSV